MNVEVVMSRNLLALVFTLSSLAPALGCATAPRPLVRADPPVVDHGVSVALIGQRCRREAYENYDQLVLSMFVRVTNTGDGPVAVRPASWRLVVPGRSRVPRETAPETDETSLAVAPHGSRDVRVKFRRPGNATCNQTLELSLDHSIEAPGQPLYLPSMSFTPEPSDT
jgi:hypothetical protein